MNINNFPGFYNSYSIFYRPQSNSYAFHIIFRRHKPGGHLIFVAKRYRKYLQRLFNRKVDEDGFIECLPSETIYLKMITMGARPKDVFRHYIKENK